jgi:hypothetical protein
LKESFYETHGRSGSGVEEGNARECLAVEIIEIIGSGIASPDV